VVTEELVSQRRDEEARDKVNRGIKKFSIFWKLTEKDHQYRPFKPLYERDEDALRDPEANRSYEPLHKMLEILRDNDPTHRLSCRSWLSESKLAYSRILDPLLIEFMNETKLSKDNVGHLFCTENYNTDFVTDNFDKLRDIILNLNTQVEFLDYICTRQQTQRV
jgi:hypothetical protein